MLNARRLILPCLFLTLTLIWGCKPSIITEENHTERASTVLVVADSGYTLDASELYEVLHASQLQPRGGTVPRAEVEAVVDSLLMDTLAGFKADEDIVLTDHYHYNWTYRSRYHELLLRQYIAHHIYSGIEVDTARVTEYFHAHPELYSLPEQVFLQHLLIAPRWFRISEDSARYNAMSPEQFDQAVKDYTYDIYQKLLDGEDFTAVAMQYTHDKLSENSGGMVGWTPRDTYVHPFDSIAFAMEPGTFSEPYWDRDGWHIIYIHERMDEGFPPLDRPEFFNVAAQGYVSTQVSVVLDSLLAELRKDLKLEYNEEVLGEDVFRSPDTLWAAVVNDVDTIDFKVMRNLEMEYRKRYQVSASTPEIKKEMIDYLANRLLVIQEARKERIDTLPNVMAEEYRVRHEAARAIVLAGRFSAEWRPSDSAISQYYNEHISEYYSERPYTVQQIIVADSLLAEFIRDQAMSGLDFIELAREYYPGEESIRAELADLGKVGPNDVDKELYNVIQFTSVGEVSPPFKTELGYHLIKVLEKAPTAKLATARGGIMTKLTDAYKAQMVRQFTNELKTRYNVRYLKNIPEYHLKPLNVRMKSGA